jgi:hypothetical protein
MPVAGAKPKADRSQVRHRIPPTHEWTDVENVPFAGAPKLRDRATTGVSVMDVGAANSGDWPEATLAWWRDVSTLPHAKLWGPTDWRFAMDTAEIHARTMEAWRGYTGTELRNREKIIGMTGDARRDLRIRYVEPKNVDAEAAAAEADNVVSINRLRDL